MGFLTRMRQQHRRGRPYDGPYTWCDDPQIVLRPGYYAVSEVGPAGKILARMPLVGVDDAPGDPDDGSWHLEYAGPKDYPQRSGGRPVEKRATVNMEADTHGIGGIKA